MLPEENPKIAQIDKIFSDALKLLDQGMHEAAMVYGRRMAEGIISVLEEREDLTFERRLGAPSAKLQKLKHVMGKRFYRLGSPAFFNELEFMLKAGTDAAHFPKEDRQQSLPLDFATATNQAFAEALKSVYDIFQNYLKEKKTGLAENTPKSLSGPNSRPVLTRLSVTKFKNIVFAELEHIPVGSNIVLIGENGVGKTTLLQAAAIGLYGGFDEKSGFALHKDTENETFIAADISFGGTEIKNAFIRFEGGYTKVERINEVVAYGVSRLQLQSPESQEDRDLRNSNVYGIFGTDKNILLNIEYWLRERYISGETEKAELVIALLAKLMPSVEPIAPKSTPAAGSPHTVVFHENGRPILSSQLSAGNKSILAMVGDMLIRLYETQPETLKPEELYGIVLIEELETHLHPLWQKEFPKLLAECFPLVQFIVSTHSPMVCLGMPANTVFFNVGYDPENGAIVKKLNIDLANLLPNQVLTSGLFGLENIRSVNNKGIEFLSVETDEEVREREAGEERLKGLLKDFKFKIRKGDEENQ